MRQFAWALPAALAACATPGEKTAIGGTAPFDPDDAPGPLASLMVISGLAAAALLLLHVARLASG
jgi:hypothetical protein